jgi:hypothetical protein
MVVLALIAAGGRRDCYVLTDGHRYTLREIYCEMCKACGRSPAPPLSQALLRAVGRLGDYASGIVHRPLPFISAGLDALRAPCYSDDMQVWRDLALQPRYSLASALPAMVAARRAGP